MNTDRLVNTARRDLVLYAALTGLAGLAVVLQGLWAGLFLTHDGARDDSGNWIDVHARGAEVAIVLAALATLLAAIRLRAHASLWIGGVVLILLLVGESYLGGLIRDNGRDSLTGVHIPLAMAIMAVSVWLPLRSAQLRRTSSENAPQRTAEVTS